MLAFEMARHVADPAFLPEDLRLEFDIVRGLTCRPRSQSSKTALSHTHCLIEDCDEILAFLRCEPAVTETPFCPTVNLCGCPLNEVETQMRAAIAHARGSRMYDKVDFMCSGESFPRDEGLILRRAVVSVAKALKCERRILKSNPDVVEVMVRGLGFVHWDRAVYENTLRLQKMDGTRSTPLQNPGARLSRGEGMPYPG
jgi:hypothetical protein